jgi:cell division protein FtsN
MKSYPSFLLSLALLFFVACGSGGEEAPATETSTAKVAAVPETTAAVTPSPDTLRPIKPEPKAPAIVERTRAGRFTVQVSSWHTRRKAEAQAQRLRERGEDAYVQKAVLENGETWYRVRVGSFETIQAAQNFAQTLNEELESGYWVDHLRDEKQP